MNIETLALDAVILDPANVRRHPARNLEAIKASLARWGQQKPIVIDGRSVVLAGNGTVIAARALGWKEIRAVRTTLAGVDAIAYALADNRTAELAEWDDDALERVLRELELQRFDVSQIAFNLADFAEPQPVVEKSAPVVSEVVTSEPGDLWDLDGSRLLCGDCTMRDHVAQLLDGKRAQLLFTDPPYGVHYGDSNKANAIRGDLSQAEIPISFGLAIEAALDDNARVYICGGSTNAMMYYKLFDRYLHQMPRLLVWVKEHFVMRHVGYHSQYELIYWGWKGRGGDPQFWYGDRKASDVLSVPRDREPLHPTQKPVALPEGAVRYSSAPGDIVFEPFAGSGSTLIAAVGAGRFCYALEIDPKFCDVIVRRWESFTGKKAKNLTRSAVVMPGDPSLFANPADFKRETKP